MVQPPVTEFEKKTNLTVLQHELHRQMKCFAGKNQVYLQSIILDNGQKTRPRIALKCSLRDEAGLDRDVYYEYIKDTCCGDPRTCPAYQMFLQKNPESAIALGRTESRLPAISRPPSFGDSSLTKPVL